MSSQVASAKEKNESLAAQTAQAGPEDKRARFPKTNKEYFTVLLKSGLALSTIVFLVLFVAAALLAHPSRWSGEALARSIAISLLAGFNLALMRLRWLKGRDR